MSQTVVELVNVGVQYKTRRSFFRHDYFTALDKINFEVNRGETLGVIGANGSGKSTLLKVLANIYGIESGKITWHCRQASLLSLSLGFDVELSGRDNAIISGMLLGARKKHIMEKLDHIVEFAELGHFIHKPIKTYSNGMRARLAFAVAIEMRSELLLIDEVLGAGDNTFRIKASKVMVDKINSNQTVVLVSHSTSQLSELCDRVLWLHEGKVKMIGDPDGVLSDYQLFFDRMQSIQ